jgi:thiol-disulfide isomerase/thioredoxin
MSLLRGGGPLLRHSLAAAAVVVLSSPPSAQSLAEVARRAAEARQAAGRGMTFGAADLNPAVARRELTEFRIDPARWTRFLAADRAAARALSGDPLLAARLASVRATSIGVFERFIVREPAFDAAVRPSMSPREYASTRLALVLAEDAARGSDTLSLHSDAIQANAGLAAAHRSEIGELAPAPRLTIRDAVASSPVSVPAPAMVEAARPARPAPAPVEELVERPDGPIDVRPGAEIPEFTYLDFNGGLGRLSDFRGRYLLLDFWGSWCGPCRAEVPHAKKAYAQFKSRGFEILGLNYEQGATPQQVNAYLKANGVTWPFATAPSVRTLISDRFQVTAFPTLILLDPDGRVVEARTGALRGEALVRTLDKVLPR